MRLRSGAYGWKVGKAAVWLVGLFLVLPTCSDVQPPPTGRWLISGGTVEDGLYGAGTRTEIVGGHMEFGDWSHTHTIVLRSTYAEGVARTDSVTRSGGAHFSYADNCDPGGPGRSPLLLFDGPGKLYDEAEVRGDTIVQTTLLWNKTINVFKSARVVWIRA